MKNLDISERRTGLTGTKSPQLNLREEIKRIYFEIVDRAVRKEKRRFQRGDEREPNKKHKEYKNREEKITIKIF